jgi:hypothetical protein
VARKTIFQKLHGLDACHAVCIAQHPLGFKDIFIVMKRTDVNKLNLYGFEEAEDNHTLMTRDLNGVEYAEFKRHEKLYQKAMHSDVGRVYELKSNGFSSWYKSKKARTRRRGSA